MAASPNAFARGLNGQVALPNGGAGHNGDARASKRARLSEDAVAAIDTRSAQSATSQEVDHMVLDYAAYQTINACLESRGAGQKSSSAISLSSNLAVYESLQSIFKSQYPSYQPDPELRLRISLLKCVTLFSQRLTSNPTTPSSSALHTLRRMNQERARVWKSDSGRLSSSAADISLLDEGRPISQAELERSRAHVLHELGVPAEDEDYEDAFYGTSSCLSLLDILPLFMHVSAIRNTMNESNPTDRWMQLACEFMLQACLEQYLVFGANRSDAIDEAFAWGYVEKAGDSIDTDARETGLNSHSNEVNDMFEDEDYATEVEGWSEVKAIFLNDLMSALNSDASADADDVDVASRLEEVAAGHPIQRLEASLLKFLEALSNSIPQPVLVQLESGRLDCMTREQTKEFLKGCGVDVARFYADPVGFKASVVRVASW